jgi:hypothetical protein
MSEHVGARRSMSEHVGDVGVMSEYVGACRSHVGDTSEESDVASETCRRNTTWDWMTNRV